MAKESITDLWKGIDLISIELKDLLKMTKMLDFRAVTTSKEKSQKPVVSDVNWFVVELPKYQKMTKNTDVKHLWSQTKLDQFWKI